MVSTKFRAGFCPGKSGASSSVSPPNILTPPRPHPPAPCPTVGWAPSEPLAWACIRPGPSEEAALGPCWLRSKLRVRLADSVKRLVVEELVRAAAFQGGVPREALPWGQPGAGTLATSAGLEQES